MSTNDDSNVILNKGYNVITSKAMYSAILDGY